MASHTRPFVGIILLLLLFGTALSFFVPVTGEQPAISHASEVSPTLGKNTPQMLVKKTDVPPPVLTAKGILVFDVAANASLLEQNADEPLFPASTTKLMTALVALDTYSFDQIVTIPPINIDGQKMRLYTGEKLSIESLLYGMLVASANDAAEALALIYPDGGRDLFIQAMNRKAQAFGLSNTQFKNPTGLDDDGQFTTARDLVRLGQEVMAHPELSQIVGTREATVFAENSIGRHQFSNVNELLGEVAGVKGIKTGWTEIAGENLLTDVEHNGREIIIAILGSADRFGETKVIIEWLHQNYEWGSNP